MDARRYAAGQPAEASFAALAGGGVKHVINLRPPAEGPDYNEAAAVTAAGMAYYNVPIASADDLTHANVEELDRLLARLDDETLLLHCSSSNRVGALMALRSAWIGGATNEQAMQVGRDWGLSSLEDAVANRLGESDE